MLNRLILGDCLDIMKSMEQESVDLIYLDPPFFSNRNYEVIWGDKGEIRSFQDRWSGGIDHYIAWLKERVEIMHRLLKPTGSIFLHCDWHAQAEIKIFILNKVFGPENFRNEIVWCYAGPGNVKNRLAQKHDTIYFYSKSDNMYFDADSIRLPYSAETIARTNRGASKTGIMGNVKGDISERHKNRINEKGKYPEDYWIDIPRLQGNGSERIGYPTQKPEKLLDRIISMGTKEGDIVLDPFVGGGTTIAVADRLGRRWVGIDQSVAAVKVTEMRLTKQQGLFSSPFTVMLHKYDYDTLRYSDAFEFEEWIILQYGGFSNSKQRGDFGIDGKTTEGIPIQVKRSDGIGRIPVDNFRSAIERHDSRLFEKNVAEGKTAGYMIAFSFGRGAIQEVARLKNERGVIIELLKVEDIVPISKKPTISVVMNSVSASPTLHEIEFVATAESEAGIEFFSWDIEHDTEKGFRASVMIDKKGKQVFKFRPGNHTIAVKVVDDDGLENVEIIKLKVNGDFVVDK